MAKKLIITNLMIQARILFLWTAALLTIAFELMILVAEGGELILSLLLVSSDL